MPLKRRPRGGLKRFLSRYIVFWGTFPLASAYFLHHLLDTVHWQLEPERYSSLFAAFAISTAAIAFLLTGLSVLQPVNDWFKKNMSSLVVGMYVLTIVNLFATASQLLLSCASDMSYSWPRTSHAIWLVSSGTFISLVSAVSLGGLSIVLFQRKSLIRRIDIIKRFTGIGALASAGAMACIPWIALAYHQDRAAILPQPQASQPIASAPKHIVLVTFDALRFRSTFAANPSLAAQTPSMAALSREATVFTQCRASADQTLTSLPSLLSGLYPPQFYSIRSNGIYRLRIGSTPSFVGSLRNAGYKTRYFTVWASPIFFGMGSAFVSGRTLAPWPSPNGLEFSFNGPSFMPFAQLLRWLSPLPPAAGPNDQNPVAFGQYLLNEFIDTPKDKANKSFDWIHLPIPHTPYHNIPDRYYGSMVRNPGQYQLNVDDAGRAVEAESEAYERYVQFGDAELGRLIRHLKSSGTWQDTLLIITSDHGEEDRRKHGFGVAPPRRVARAFTHSLAWAKDRVGRFQGCQFG